MFQLDNVPARLASYNARSEAQGRAGDSKKAADLKFEMKVPASVLANFDPDLRGLLFYRNAAVVTPAPGGDLASQGEDAPNLRFPKLHAGKAFTFDADMIGAKVIVHRGVTGASDIPLEDCKVNAIQFTPLEGGTIVLELRAQFHPTEQQAGKLCMLVQEMVEVSIAPPPAGDPNSEKAF